MTDNAGNAEKKNSVVADVLTMSIDEFAKKYQHPFLVVGDFSEGDKDGESEDLPVSFQTMAVSNAKTAYAEGAVYPVIKRRGANTFSFITIGRSKNNDIVIDAGAISKLHAVIQEKDSQFTLMDSSSTNGTRLNDHPLIPQKPIKMNPGDLITFAGQISARFFDPRAVYIWIVKKGLTRSQA